MRLNQKSSCVMRNVFMLRLSSSHPRVLEGVRKFTRGKNLSWDVRIFWKNIRNPFNLFFPEFAALKCNQVANKFW